MLGGYSLLNNAHVFYGVSGNVKPQFLMIVLPNPDKASSVDTSCWTKLGQDRIKTSIQQLGYRTPNPRDSTTN